MVELIKSTESFTLPPIGPVGDHISSTNLRCLIPASFLQSYVVNSVQDAKLLYQLFVDNKHLPPTVMIYPFDHQTHYDDDVQMNKQMLEALQAENPIIANLIVDHFEDHLKGMYTIK